MLCQSVEAAVRVLPAWRNPGGGWRGVGWNPEAEGEHGDRLVWMPPDSLLPLWAPARFVVFPYLLGIFKEI